MVVTEQIESQTEASADATTDKLQAKVAANIAAMQETAAGDLETERDQVLDRAWEEYCALIKNGIDMDATQFCQRYPRHQSSLCRLIGAQRAAEEVIKELAREKKKLAWPKRGALYLGFHILRELGRGGSSRVFLATEPALGNRVVVVKVSPRGAAEAKTMGRLSHPNIVPVHSVKTDPASKWTAVCMPFLGSATLHNVLDRVLHAMPARAQAIVEAAKGGVQFNPGASPPEPWPLPPSATYVEGVCHLGAQLADALQFLYQRGICHRDLKPSNVLLTAEGRPMLLDFNACNTVRLGPASVAGTPPYMSPEQIMSLQDPEGPAAKELNGCSDLYALGVMLYELLSGRHPFGPVPDGFKLADLLPQLLERQRRGPPSLEKLNPAVPAQLARFVERCLAFNPAQRPQRAAEVAEALRPRPSARKQGTGGASRHPWLSIAAFILMLIFGGAALHFSQPPRDPAELILLGQQAYRDRHYSKAVEHFSEALKVDNNRLDALLARAQAYLRCGESDEQFYNVALSDFLLAEARQPRGKISGEISAGAAYCMLRGNATPKQAMFKLKEALANQFATVAVHNNLAFCLMKQRDFDEALKHLDLALAKSPFMREALHNRAMLRMDVVLRSGGFWDPPQLARAKAKSPQLEPMCLELLRQGKEDLTKAMHGAEAVPMELNLDAARLWAISTAYEPNDRVFAMVCLENAVNQGYDPSALNSDNGFRYLWNDARFQKICAAQGIIRPVPPTPRIVNPLADL